MYSPQQFEVNEVWIAIKVNSDPIIAEGAPYDCHVLIDAGSCFALGFLLAPEGEAPDADECTELFDKAFAGKNEWAKRLFLTGTSAADQAFRAEAEGHGLAVEVVPEAELRPIVGPLKADMRKMFQPR